VSGRLPLADRAATVAERGRRTVHRGHRGLEIVDVDVTLAGGHAGPSRDYEVLRVGRVAAVLPYDPARDQVLLIRQFRLGAHLAHGFGENVEVIAGRVDPGESVIDAARREAFEEAGVTVSRIAPVMDFAPAPAASDEYATLFLAEADLGAVPARAGLAAEGEIIHPVVVSVEAAVTALGAGAIRNGYTLIALAWLARERATLRMRLGEST